MKKTIIALAVLGAAAGVAHAQSSVTIYGIADTGYIKETGRDVRMGENMNNRIGFRGREDLGGGLKATFELEKRFDLYDGTLGNTNTAQYRNMKEQGGKDWDGAANIGLAGNWGRVRLGRVDELTTETIRDFDPFYQYGVGSMIHSTQRSEGIDNTLRYDSPKWAGFSFGASYSLGEGTQKGEALYGAKYDNDGYALNLSYDNGPFMATANWSRVADSNDSSVWNLGVGYKFGPARVTLAYEKTNDKGFKGGISNLETLVTTQEAFLGVLNSVSIEDWVNVYFSGADTDLGIKSKQEVWLLGLEWDIGPGQLDASVQYGQLNDVRGIAAGVGTTAYKLMKDRDIMKYAIGYTYNLSKRTSAYVQAAYTDYDEKDAGLFYTGMARDSMTSFQIGMTHKF